MNCEFEKVFTNDDKGRALASVYIAQSEKLQHIELTMQDMEKALTTIKTLSAPGPDRVNPTVLRECAGVLCNPLHKLFVKSLSSGNLPRDWKTANITPIYKKGCKTDPLNYRPVSLTSAVC